MLLLQLFNIGRPGAVWLAWQSLALPFPHFGKVILTSSRAFLKHLNDNIAVSACSIHDFDR